MEIGKLSNVAIGDIDNVSSASDLAKIDGVDWIQYGLPTTLRLNIANNGDSWDPRLRMYSGTGVIDWGDGTPTEPVFTVSLPPHTYAASGTYDVTLTPNFGSQTRILGKFPIDPPDTQVTQVIAFGDCGSVSFSYFENFTSLYSGGWQDLLNLSVPFWSSALFRGCKVFSGSTLGTGYINQLGAVQGMSSTFSGASVFNGANLGNLDTSAVTFFGFCFAGTAQSNSGPELWDTSLGTVFSNMFDGTPFNRDLSGYNMSSAEFIPLMFNGATQFNNGGVVGVGQGLDTWDVSNVTAMYGLFLGASNFNARLDSWVINPLVGSFSNFFDGCENFDNGGASGVNVGIDNWDVSNVTNFNSMFKDAGSNNKDGFYIGSWDTSSAENMTRMFQDSHVGKTNASGVGNWNVGNVDDFTYTFRGARDFNEDLSSWNTSSAENMTNMFNEAIEFNNGAPIGTGNNGGVGVGIDNWNTSLVTDMSYMFHNAIRFSWYIGSWDVSNVDNMKFMFSNAFDLFVQVPGSTLGIENWNTGNVKNMEEMFSGIIDVPIGAINGNWDFRKVTTLKGFCVLPNAALPDAQLDALVDAEGALAGMSAPNVATTLVGWDNYANTNTGVNATNLFGSVSMSQSTYSNAKAAYDNLIDSVANGGKGWTITGITWTP